MTGNALDYSPNGGVAPTEEPGVKWGRAEDDGLLTPTISIASSKGHGLQVMQR